MIDERVELFDVTYEQRAVDDLAREFAREQIAPFITRWDREHTFPRELYTKLNALGLMGMLVPEAFGGVQTGYLSYGYGRDRTRLRFARGATTTRSF